MPDAPTESLEHLLNPLSRCPNKVSRIGRPLALRRPDLPPGKIFSRASERKPNLQPTFVTSAQKVAVTSCPTTDTSRISPGLDGPITTGLGRTSARVVRVRQLAEAIRHERFDQGFLFESRVEMTTSNQLAPVQATMSSLELVDLINEVRKASGKSLLNHSNYLKRVERHPGIQQDEFSAEYIGFTGQVLKCYRLPQRECCLSLSSESPALQAQVYDRLTKAMQERSESLRRTKPKASAVKWGTK